MTRKCRGHETGSAADATRPGVVLVLTGIVSSMTDLSSCDSTRSARMGTVFDGVAARAKRVWGVPLQAIAAAEATT